MTALRKSETRKLIASLEAQGCRIEWATVGNRGVGRVGRFPVKVWPPNKDRHFILLHDTVSSPNDVTVKRTEVQRAGLTWPFDDKKATKALEKNSRKEQQMTSTDAAAEVVQSGEPMQHVQVPPSVAKRPHPPEVKSIQAIEPYLNGMPPTFWTDELVSRLMADNVSGYRNKHSGTQAAQSLLDWLGWRVVEAKRNRNGYSYRWVKDPNAVVLPGVTAAERVAKAAAARYGKPEATVTPIRANGEPVREVTTNVGTALQDALQHREAVSSTALDKGDHDGHTISLEPAHKQLHHDRRQCATCNRWFTPEGYDRHISDTGHGAEAEAVPQGNERIEVSPDGNLRDLDLVVSGNGRGETPYTISIASNTVAKADYDALEAMALENERKLAEAVHGKDEVIAQRDELNARLSEVELTLERERSRAEREADELRERVAQLGQAAAQAQAQADDGSWLLEDDVLDGDMTLIELAANARRMGVTLEIRVRRA